MERLVKATFTSSGSWVCPAGVTQVLVYAMGGGSGGDGGSTGSASNGAQANKAGTAVSLQPVLLTVVPNTTYTITIGAGGTGGAPATKGGDGGNTSFGALMTWYGGYMPTTLAFYAGSFQNYINDPSTGAVATATNMVCFAMGGPANPSNGTQALIGCAGYRGLGAAIGTGPVSSTAGGNGSSGMGGEGIGGTGGSSATAAVGGNGGSAAANTGAGGGAGAGGGSTSKAGGSGGNGGSGLMHVCWVE